MRLRLKAHGRLNCLKTWRTAIDAKEAELAKEAAEQARAEKPPYWEEGYYDYDESIVSSALSLQGYDDSTPTFCFGSTYAPDDTSSSSSVSVAWVSQHGQLGYGLVQRTGSSPIYVSRIGIQQRNHRADIR